MKNLFKSPIGTKEEKLSKTPEAKELANIMMGGKKTGNQFLDAKPSHDARTANAALSHASTDDTFVDDFSNSGSYRDRPTDDVFNTMSVLWMINPLKAFKLALYLRLITRNIKGFFTSDTVQRGQGNRDESLRRMLWIAYNNPVSFYANLWLIPLAGSFKDLWTLLGMDYKNLLDNKKFFEVMELGLNNPDLRALVVKYMPQIKAKSKLKTDRARILNALAKEFAKFRGMSFIEYRKFKTKSGEAHRWQQNVSRGYFDKIDFNTISGKALMNLVSGKFLKNNKLEDKYTAWIESKPIAKFTGYVYELYAKAKKLSGSRYVLGQTYKYDKPRKELTKYQKMTFNKQFDGIIELAKKDTGGITGNVWCALDTSGSMFMSSSQVAKDIFVGDVAISLGIFFSTLNTGAFHKNVIMFSAKSKRLQLTGNLTDMASQIPVDAMGDTNFQSVIDEIIRIRNGNPNIPIEDYPETLLVISDMQFNPGYSPNYYNHRYGFPIEQEKTNFEEAQAKLKAVGLPAINIIWWQVNGTYGNDYPSKIGDKGTVMLSGFDGSVITQVLGGNIKEKGELDMVKVMNETLNQQLLVQVKL